MWVLLGVSYETIEQEPFVYFMGAFDDLSLAKQKLDHLITVTNTKRCNYIIKPFTVNNIYDYHWSNLEEDEVK